MPSAGKLPTKGEDDEALQSTAKPGPLPHIGFAIPSGTVKAAAQTTTVCGNNNSGLLGSKNQYLFEGDQWNASYQSVNQCLQITNSTAAPPSGPSSNYVSGTFNDTGGAPADYPDFLYGCFYSTCTQNTNLPIQVSQFSNWSITSGETVVEPSGYNNDVAYDIWFNTGPTTPTNQNTTGTELMIWVQHKRIGPADWESGSFVH